IDKSLSDGFDSMNTSSAASFTLPDTASDSWSYRLVAGADTAASNLMQVAGALPQGVTGKLTVAKGTPSTGTTTAPKPIMIRTGNGSIDIATAGNLEFVSRASVIYTAGVRSS